jgi:hypothetical protein
MGEQSVNLLAGEHGGKSVVIFGADLGEDRPVRLAQEVDKTHFGGGEGLPDGFGLPMLLEFDEEEIVAQLGLGEGRGISGEMFVEESELSIIGMAGAVGVVAQGQEVSQLCHGRVGMVIIDGIGVVSGRGPNAWGCGGPRSPLALLSAKGSLRAAVRLMVEVAGE